MESWSFGCEGKGFVLSDEMVSANDALSRSRTASMGWDLKTPFDYENTMLDSGREAIDNQGAMEFGFPDIMRKSLPDNLIEGFSGGSVSSARMSSPNCMVTLKTFLGEQESSSRLSSSMVDSNSQDSSFIDLKLGRFTDYRDPQNSKHSTDMPVLSSAVSCVPEKRSRTTHLTSQTPYCQVHGCNKDLSSSKDYHKRHKVCEVHSKTAKVIVNGIEQRFCQQCSRFHLLPEFDDGKRSCRKRLAGHNARRRKPQLDNRFDRTSKMLPSYHGSRFLGTSLPARTSFVCADIFPSGILNSSKYDSGNWGRGVKLEDDALYNPQSAAPVSNMFSKSCFSSFGMEQQYTSMDGNGNHTTTGSISYENNRYPYNFPGSNSISPSVLRNASSGNEDFNAFDTTSTMQGLSGVSDSGCALSLLSASQPQNSSSRSSGIPMAHPLFIQGSNTHYSVGQVGLSSEASTSVASNRYSSSRMNSMELEPGPILVSDASDAVDFEVHTDDIFQGSDFLSSKDPISHEQDNTVDLLQLSSQLQRVEHQRHSMQVKQENNVFSCFSIN